MKLLILSLILLPAIALAQAPQQQMPVQQRARMVSYQGIEALEALKNTVLDQQLQIEQLQAQLAALQKQAQAQTTALQKSEEEKAKNTAERK